MRDALAQSMNIPAVKTLYLAGVTDALQMAQKLGITTLTDASRYGLTLVLGGGEVSLLEMTGAYSVFANDGVRNPPTGILRVEDRDGAVLEEYTDKSERVLEPEIARQMNDVLSDNVARTPEFGADSPLNFPEFKVADKTGTTNDYRDVWIIGYTPGVAVGAWAGNNNNSPMQKKIAAFIIAPMWHEFMSYAMTKYPSEPFTEPAPDPEADSLAPVLRGEWNTNPSQGIHDILHWVDKDNPRTPGGSSRGDGQYPYWDYPVQLWAAGQPTPAGADFGGGTEPGGAPAAAFRILSPEAGSFVRLSMPMSITAYYPNPANVTQVTYMLNGIPIGTANQPPYAITHVPTSPGPQSLQAIVQTTMGTETTQIPFTVQ
jgi:membrane peptidoglycan carboxypeptidase